MNKKKMEKWLKTRREITISEHLLDSITPFLSNKKIDRQTSSDLLLKEYFQSIDDAITTPGRNTLYAILHTPLSNCSDIENRRNFLKLLSGNEGISNFLYKTFWRVRYSPVYSVNSILFENPVSLFTREKLVLLLMIFIFLVITVPLLYTQLALHSILVFFIISFLIFARNLSIYNKLIPGFINFAAHYHTAKKIVKQFKACKIRDPYIDELADSLPAVSSILPGLRVLRTGSYTSGDPFQLMIFWIKNLFCLDLLAYNKAVDIISSKRASFLNFYCCYGMIDALLVISKLVTAQSEIFCEAEFHTERRIYAENTFHPLIPDAVSNSVTINSGMILTGSNMAGKSTFLRTIGLNCLLAQTLGYSYAKRISMPFLNIVTVINKQDNLTSGESFYFYEAKRISNMLNRDNKNGYLFLIDELLSGTNSTERISASISIIKHLLTKRNIISLIATHDIAIASRLADDYECSYFSDYIKNNNMEFDYKLKKGIIKTTNAIRMLELLGLPASVITEAKALTKDPNLIAHRIG